MSEQKIWLNKPQKLSRLIMATEEYGVWGRATGKTDEPIANRSSHGANQMPRGTTGVIAQTYMQLLDRTLPPLFKAWERFGYRHGVHYWVRQRPPAKLKIDDPIYKALDPSHYIYWYNGHVFYLISQDRQGLANAKSLDAILADEVKFLNFDQYLDEVVPANRGNDNIFGHMWEHHMVTMYTDMPTQQKARWILEKAQQVDMETIGTVINLQIEYNKMLAEYELPRTTTPRKNYLYRKLCNYYLALNELKMGVETEDGDRSGLLWYSEANTLENIQILGERKFNQWIRELKEQVFDTSIMNLKNLMVEDGFFHLFDSQYHCYQSYDYNYVDTLGLYLPNGVEKDCRKDGDVIKNKPLDIALDYNDAIKSLVVGQDSIKHYRVLNSMFVLRKDSKVLRDLIDDFCKYYQYHPCKEVHFYYDNTATGGNAARIESFADDVKMLLREKGWTVHSRHIGLQPKQHIRYKLWEIVFAEKDKRFKPVRFNADNAEQLVASIQQTGVVQTGEFFAKDKRPERQKKVAPEDAPHLGDAFETLYIGRFKEEYGYNDAISDLIIV
ncbi:hypothetical protein OQZ33_04395 [Pedobacter sp. MC2016-05]|uniref:hypothetical protein n=1 Tax=Pedobacter sp. MC2016-05 TaxID=2994474 RepID=UPI0022471345|nr:hypothetical protein [Pedobacter sp. MC2016-05]MCX2473566.1 hypothetical protein [Pedobacter sp. MC2016-05]